MKRGTRLIAVCAVWAALTAAPAPAAETIDSSTFAARCSAAAKVLTISTDTLVKGGAGVFTKDCELTLAPGVTLAFAAASLSTPVATRWGLILDGGEGSTVEIRDTTISLGGGMNLCPGFSYATGQHFDRGQVVIANSTIQGATFGLIIGPSFGASGGSVEIRRSTLRAGPGTVLLVQASCGGGVGYLCGEGPAGGGRVEIFRATLDAGPHGMIDVSTEAAGRTTLRRSTLVAPAGTMLVHAGSGGRCEALDNVPSAACQ